MINNSSITGAEDPIEAEHSGVRDRTWGGGSARDKTLENTGLFPLRDEKLRSLNRTRPRAFGMHEAGKRG
jgi:hypothetical protein